MLPVPRVLAGHRSAVNVTGIRFDWKRRESLTATLLTGVSKGPAVTICVTSYEEVWDPAQTSSRD